MMPYIIGITIIVVWMGAVLGCVVWASEIESWIPAVAGVVIFILGLAFVMQKMAEEDQQGPCLKVEVSMAWNAASKSMQPYTHCVDRGTWVNK